MTSCRTGANLAFPSLSSTSPPTRWPHYMDSIDFRILRVGIEISGEIKIFESPFGITAKGSKFASATQNTCTVEIFNLSKADRNYLLTETSPFNKSRTPKKIWVEAGRVSTGTARMFTGEIVTSSPSQPPDIGLELKIGR